MFELQNRLCYILKVANTAQQSGFFFFIHFHLLLGSYVARALRCGSENVELILIIHCSKSVYISPHHAFLCFGQYLSLICLQAWSRDYCRIEPKEVQTILGSRKLEEQVVISLWHCRGGWQSRYDVIDGCCELEVGEFRLLFVGSPEEVLSDGYTHLLGKRVALAEIDREGLYGLHVSTAALAQLRPDRLLSQCGTSFQRFRGELCCLEGGRGQVGMAALVVGRQIQGQCGVGGERRGRRGGFGCGRWLAVGGFLELVELLFLHGDYKLIINPYQHIQPNILLRVEEVGQVVYWKALVLDSLLMGSKDKM